MPAIRNAARAVIVRDGAILLQVCRIDGELLHILPGGTQEFGEPLDATVRREVLEETGLSVRVDGLLWVCELVEPAPDPSVVDGTHVVGCIFRCTPEADLPIMPASLPDVAQIDVRWVMLSELPALTLVPRAVQPLLISWHEQGGELAPGYLRSSA
jgi:8-oxo-dGTP diphosphatase